MRKKQVEMPEGHMCCGQRFCRKCTETRERRKRDINTAPSEAGRGGGPEERPRQRAEDPAFLLGPQRRSRAHRGPEPGRAGRIVKVFGALSSGILLHRLFCCFEAVCSEQVSSGSKAPSVRLKFE